MTKTKKLSDSILEKIKNEKVTQKSRWYFVFKNSSFWTIFSLSVLFGALGFSVILFAFFESDFDLFSLASAHHREVFWTLLPFFWICFFVAFVALSIWGIHATKKGYKLSLILLLGINIFSSVALGSVFYGFGGGEKLERIFDERAPFYEGFETRMKRVWQNPDQGRIAGIIFEIRDKDTLLILDEFRGIRWEVNYATANIRNGNLQAGMPVKILGNQQSEILFFAKEIRSFMPRRMEGRMKRHPELRDQRRSSKIDQMRMKEGMDRTLFREERK